MTGCMIQAGMDAAGGLPFFTGIAVHDAWAPDALREMKRLADAALATDGTLTSIDQDLLATARHQFRSAVLIGEKQTTARAGPLMAKHHALARRLRQRQDDYLRFTTDPARRSTTTRQNARSGWENSA